MSPADGINISFFAFFTAFAWLRPMEQRKRKRATAIGFIATSLIVAALALPGVAPSLTPTVPMARDWIRVPLMLLAYWQAGQFFRHPNAKLQAWLEGLDHRLVRAIQELGLPGSFPIWIASYLEFSYLLCYLVVPAALAAIYLSGMHHFTEYFWKVVLPPTYLCYAMVPFLQTLPPRMVVSSGELYVQGAKGRALNLWILGHASIHVNTFPSAHVAASVATSLALLRLLPEVGLAFLCVAISIAVASVVGRYHYAADAVIGAALSVASFLLLGRSLN